MRVRDVAGAAMAAGILLAQAAPASAQAAASGQAAVTVLHLGDTASVQAPPDQLVAELSAQATSRSPATSQAEVNASVAQAMTSANRVAGVASRAIGYSVAPVDEKRTAWTAQQTVELRSADATALLDLAGRLQQSGLVMASLDWQLSEPARRKAHDAATIAALKQLQARARDAAAALDLHVDHLTDVRLDETPQFQPRPGPVMMMMAARASAPQATAAPETVSASVSADVMLHP